MTENFNPNPYGTIKVNLDRSATEQRLMDEKDSIQKELTELKLKEQQRQEAEKLGQEEKAKLEAEQSAQSSPRKRAAGFSATKHNNQRSRKRQ